MELHPSDSSEQQKAGVEMINLLSQQLRIPLESKSVELGDGSAVQIDGFSYEPPVMCEAWSHIGKPKGSQPDKVMSDAFKLVFCEKRLGRRFRKILLFADPAVKEYFSGNSWQAECLRDYGVELRVAELPALLDGIRKAQERQFR